MQDLTDSPLAAVCCGKLRGMFYGVWAVGTGLAGLNGFAARCSLRGKLREMFYGLRAVETGLAGLNGFAARCSLRGKLWEMFYGLRAVEIVLADLTGLPLAAVCEANCGKYFMDCGR